MKASSIGEFFGTLLASVDQAHIKHLDTKKFSTHKALEDYYDEAGDLVDTIIEAYQGIYGIVDTENNVLEANDTTSYFHELRDYVVDSREALIDKKDSEIWSEIDSLLTLIDGTIYKLENLTESRHLKSLYEYIKESCDKESCGTGKNKKKIINEEDKITDEKTFRKFALAKLKKMHGDKFDEDIANRTIDGMVKDKKDDEDWGTLIGKLNHSM